ncbi:MAG: fatty acid desaturase family protein [Gammaproteobacteria bacterium]
MSSEILKKDSVLFKQLKQEIHDALANQPNRSSRALYLKTGLLACAWLLTYINYLWSTTFDSAAYHFISVFFLFLTTSALSFNVIHEGSHRAFSVSKSVNRSLQILVACICGISTINWFEKHIKRHHVYTNIHNKDFDINSKGLFRYSPIEAWKPWHKWQSYYAIPLYGLYVLKWIYLSDLRDLLLNIYELSLGKRFLILMEIILTRCFHILLFIVIPSFYFSSLSACIGYYCLFLFMTGFTIAVTFQLAHILPNMAFFNPSEGIVENRLHHQLSTTADFSVNNPLIAFFTGGLNMQIVHHLFPHVSHLDHPIIQPIIKEFCQKNNLPYHEYPNCITALKAHFSYLKVLGIKPT